MNQQSAKAIIKGRTYLPIVYLTRRYIFSIFKDFLNLNNNKETAQLKIDKEFEKYFSMGIIYKWPTSI